MERKIMVHRPYKHFKGTLYYVHDILEDTETGEKIVSYQALYAPYKMYARAYDVFASEVDKKKYPDAQQKYRFELFGSD